jgi:oligosaccharide repeat unit polymerase
LIKILRNSILFFALCLFSISIYYNDLNILLISIFILFIHNIIFFLANIQERVIFGAFHVTFFTFLLGNLAFNKLSDESAIIIFSEGVQKHILITLFISLLCIFLGYIVSTNKGYYSINKTIDYDSNNIRLIRTISKYVYYISYIPYLICLLDKVNFVSENNYISYYTQYTSSIPHVVVSFGQMSIISFALFLATMPNKKESRLPIILYLIYTFLSLGYGQRNTFVLNSLFIFIYFIIRNKINPERKKWLEKKHVILIMIATPFIIVSLNNFAFTRENKVVEQTSRRDVITDFFVGQGQSINIIGYGKSLENSFPPNKMYTFGPLIYYMRNNVITQFIFDIPKYKSNTVDMALYGNSFGQTISYLVIKDNYLAGRGMGSCYIAEVYKDFGYIGIVIINLVYGYFFANINKQLRYNVWLTAFLLISIKYILLSPRADTLTFLTSSINMINIFTLGLIWFVYKILNNRNKIHDNDFKW